MYGKGMKKSSGKMMKPKKATGMKRKPMAKTKGMKRK